jgi:hypothetical protein
VTIGAKIVSIAATLMYVLYPSANADSGSSPSLSALSGPAPASYQWPDSFDLKCGSAIYKDVYDGNAYTQYTPVISSTAERTPIDEMGGHYHVPGSFGYHFGVAMINEKLFGTNQPQKFNMYCATQSVTDLDQAKMSCDTDVKALDSVPGFNMVTGSMTVPGPLKGGELRITVRTRDRIKVGTDSHSDNYYDLSLETACYYSNYR